MNTSSGSIPESFIQIRNQVFYHIQAILKRHLQAEPFVKEDAFVKGRADIEIAFDDGLKSQLDKIIQSMRKQYHTGVIGEVVRNFDGLMLVDKEELSLQLICDSFVEAAFEKIQSQLAVLTMRFEHIAGQDLEIEDILLAPDVLSELLRKALVPVEVDYKLKSELLKHVLNDILVEYVDLIVSSNNIFIDNGILSDLNESDGKARFKRNQSRVEAQEKRKSLLASISQNVTYDDDGNPVAPKMDEVLENLDISESFSEHIITSSDSAEYIDQSSLIEQIDEAYSGDFLVADEDIVEYKEFNSTSTLAGNLTEKASLDQYVIDKKNSSTIGMMSMLFEDLFSKMDFEPPIKALLEQMQIPLLKTAILDKKFFVDSGNPAQVLLDKMAEAGASWEPSKEPARDFLYKKMAEIINQVNRNFDNTYDVFVNAIFEFDEFKKKHQEKTVRIEERIVSMEKAVARQDRARMEAQNHIKKTFKGFKLADPLYEFVANQWQNVLFFIHNKYDSENNDEWRKAIDAEENFINVLDGVEGMDRKKAIYALQSELMASGQEKAQVNLELNKIIPFVKKALKEEVVEEEIVEEVIEEAKYQPLPSMQMDKPETQAKPQESDFLSGDSEFFGESEVVEKAEEQIEKPVGLTESQVKEQLQNQLTVGTWLKDKPPGGDPVKVKVAAYIKHTDTYVLVNRSGRKHGSLNSLELYEKLKEGSMTLVESALVFDKALESVIVGLRG